ncbi:MAG TPA: twin-arginine translocase subunit TatC [Acidimicrobiales bacterium]|nr:twin-arginine translocase subunit TatC [Acidimicrobiales bacterium]
MTLTEHLAELRQRLLICLAVFVLAAIASYALYPQIINFLRHPLCHADPQHCSLYVTAPLDAFGFRLDAMGLGGALLASPVILYHLWRFVTPGLKTNERRYAIPFVLASLALFAFGVFVAWLTLPHALAFLLHQGGPGVKPLLQANRYLSLVIALLAIFGLTFEFPVVLVGLELAGAVRPAQLAKSRRIAIIAIVVIAAVVTPSSDPFSMLALAVPLLVFYEASIVLGRLLKP